MKSDTAAIRVSGLEKTYKNVHALRGLDFEIPTGQVTGFVGPNGAGKTTTFRSLLGLTRPNAGMIEVLGHSVPRELSAITKKVGAIIEEPGLIKALSGRINLQIAADTFGFGHDNIEGLLEFVDLTNDATRKVDGYSKGMRQRLGLASALLGEPELLILDEPLDGLDPAGQKVFKALLRALAEEGRTAVVSSHDMADIEALADYIVVIDRGTLVSQGPLHVLLEGGVIRVVLADPDRGLQVLVAAGLSTRRDDGGLVVESDDGAAIIRALTEAGIYPTEVAPMRSSLESVFLGITGDERS